MWQREDGKKGKRKRWKEAWKEELINSRTTKVARERINENEELKLTLLRAYSMTEAVFKQLLACLILVSPTPL